MFQERRKYKRLAVCRDNESNVMVQNGSIRVAGTLLNLSLGGALLALADATVQAESGTTVSLSLQSDGHWFQVKAAIVRSAGPAHIAVQFIDLTETETEELRAKLTQMELILGGS